MAIIDKTLALMSFGNTFSRMEGKPLDSSEIYYSLDDARTYAASAVAYVGQTIKVVDEANGKATAYLIKNTAGDLQEVGSGAGSIVVSSESEMLALTDIKNGQMVFRSDKGVFFVLTNETNISSLDSWTEQSGGSTWVGTEDKVNFYSLTKAQYDAIASKSITTLYFISDLGKIYKGEVDVTEAVSAYTTATMPEVADAVSGKLYVDTDTLECKVKSGDSYYVLTPGYITDGSNWAQATDDHKLATIGAIKTGIEATIASKVDSMGAGNADEVVLSTADGGIKRSTVKIGGETISETPDASTLATEKAVVSKFAWKFID